MPRLIFHIERSYCETYGLESSLLNLSFWERYTWLVVLGVSGHTDHFPQSLWAQVLASMAAILSYIVAVSTILYNYLKKKRMKKRRKGEEPIFWNNHLVICGWNKNARLLVEDLLEDKNEYGKGRRPKIVLVHPKIASKVKESKIIMEEVDKMEMTRKISIVNQEPSASGALEGSNINKAKTIILLADSDGGKADERTLLRALAISRFCKTKNRSCSTHDGNKNLDSAYIIAEINDRTLRQSLYDNEVNEVVCSSEMGVNTIFQSALNHGISEVLASLSDFKRDNEFYILRLEDAVGLRGRKFDELLFCLRRRDILLLGIKATITENVNEEGTNGTIRREIIDRNEIKRILAQGGEMSSVDERNQNLVLTRQIMINPVRKEKNYITDSDDELVVLAANQGVIDELLKASSSPEFWKDEGKALALVPDN